MLGACSVYTHFPASPAALAASAPAATTDGGSPFRSAALSTTSR